MASTSSQEAVIFDGDDTLWETERLYDEARSEAARIVGSLGLDDDEFQRLQKEVDVQNVGHYGFSAKRFPTSSVQAYELLAQSSGRDVDPGISDQIFAISSRVFEQRAPLCVDALEVVEQLRPNYRLGLLTKGDPEVQTKRIDDSGLRPYFEATNIVSDKNAVTFSAILDELGIAPASAWSVGNSLRSDILPALEIGMRAIWIEAHVWDHERSHGDETKSHPGLYLEERLAVVPTVLAAPRA